MRRWLGVLVFVALAGVGLPVPAQAAPTNLPVQEARVLQMVNATRAEHGLSALVWSPELVGIARAQSERMAARGDIFHNTNLASDLTRLSLPWQSAGENVGVGPSVDNIEQAFLDSPHHYENIVRERFGYLGVGVLADGGRVWVTQVFAQLGRLPAPVPATLPAPKPAPSTPRPTIRPSPRPVPTIRPTTAPPAPAAIRGGIIRPGPIFSVEPDGPSGAFTLVRALLGLITVGQSG